jgi:DNA replication protein DnaC
MTPIVWDSTPDILGTAAIGDEGVETSPCLHIMKKMWLEDTFSAMFIGPAGTGKTHAAVQWINAYAIANPSPYTSLYISMVDLETMLDDEMREYKRMSGTISRLCDRKLLVMDDLGAERKTEFLERAVFSILQKRFNKPTLITTNMMPDEFLSRYGARIHSRLQCFTLVYFTGRQLRFARV